ncbi:serine/arginine repetitive matrix protein 2, partial [Ruminococcus sp. AM18-15]
MRRFFFLQNSPVDCFVKPKELTELGTGRSQFVRAGVRRVQPFVHGYRECNIPVQ